MPGVDSNATYGGDDSVVSDILDAGGVQSGITVGTSAVEVKVGASKLANRKLVTAQPKANGVFWGYTSGVTTSSGTELFKDQVLAIAASETTEVWLIASTAGNNVRITESP